MRLEQGSRLEAKHPIPRTQLNATTSLDKNSASSISTMTWHSRAASLPLPATLTDGAKPARNQETMSKHSAARAPRVLRSPPSKSRPGATSSSERNERLTDPQQDPH